MSQVIIPKDKWSIVKGERKPIIECPSCGSGLLGDATIHGIKEDGTVYNSVVCDCGFHEHVKLEGWEGGHIKRGTTK